MTIRAIFFDYGGVIATINMQEIQKLERRYGLPDRGMWEALFCTTEWDNVQVGKSSESTWLKNAENQLELLANKPIAELKKDWLTAWRKLDQKTLNLAKKLGNNYKVGMISNATRSLNEELKSYHKISHLFNPIINSAEVGIAKPDERIYHIAAEKIKEEPGVCLHIDDLEPNVSAAIAAGFKSIHYSGDYEELEESLKQIGINW